jgi:hypothetical protein
MAQSQPLPMTIEFLLCKMSIEWSVGINVIAGAIDNGWQVSEIKIEHRTWKLFAISS